MANDIIINVLAKAQGKEVNQLYNDIKKVEDEAEKGAKVKLNVDDAVTALNSLRGYLQKMNQALGNDESKMANFAQMTEDVNRMSSAVGDLAEKFKLIKFDEKNGSFESIARIKDSLDGINSSLLEIKGSMGVFGNAEQLKDATEKFAEAKKNLDEAGKNGEFAAGIERAKKSIGDIFGKYANFGLGKEGKQLRSLIEGELKFDQLDSDVQKLVKDMMMLKEAGKEIDLSKLTFKVPEKSDLTSIGKNASELLQILIDSKNLLNEAGKFNVTPQANDAIAKQAETIKKDAQEYANAVEKYDDAQQKLEAAQQRANSVSKVAFDDKSIKALTEAMSGINIALGKANGGKGDVTFGIDKQALQDITNKIGEVTTAVGQMKESFSQGLTIKGVSATGEELDQMEQQLQEQIKRLMKYQSDVSAEIQKINASFKGLDRMDDLVTNIEAVAESLDTLYNSMKNIEGVGNTAGREAGKFVENLKESGIGDIVGTSIKAEDLKAITTAIGNVQKAIDGIFKVGEGKELSVFQTQLTGVFNTSAIETWKNDFIRAIGEMSAAAKQLNPNQIIVTGSGKTPAKPSTKTPTSSAPQQKSASVATTSSPKKQYIDVLSVKKTNSEAVPRVLPENISNSVKEINDAISEVPKVDENNLDEAVKSFNKVAESLLKINEVTGEDISDVVTPMADIASVIDSLHTNVADARNEGVDYKSDEFAEAYNYFDEENDRLRDFDASTFDETVMIIAENVEMAKQKAVDFINRISETMSTEVPVVEEYTSNLPFMQDNESISRYKNASNISNIISSLENTDLSESLDIDPGVTKEQLLSKLEESGIILSESFHRMVDEYYEKLEESNQRIKEASVDSLFAGFMSAGEDEANLDSSNDRASAEEIKAQEQEKIEEVKSKLLNNLKRIYSDTLDQFIISIGSENNGLSPLQDTSIGDDVIFDAQSKIAKSVNVDEFLSDLISRRVNKLSSALSEKTLVPELERGKDDGFLGNMGEKLETINNALSGFEEMKGIDGIGDISQVSEKVKIAQENIRLLVEAVDAFATNQGVEGYDFTQASSGKTYEEMANAAKESLSIARESLTSFAQATQKETQEVSQIAEKAKETSTTTSSTPSQTTKATTTTTTPATQAPTVPEQKPVINPKDIENAEQLSSILSSISTMFAGKEKISADMFGGEDGFKPVLQTLQEIASAIRMVARSFQQLRGESKVFAPLEQYLGNITVQAELAADEVRNLNEAIEEEQVPAQDATPVVTQQVEQQEQAQERVAEAESEVVAGKEQEKAVNNEIIEQFNTMIRLLGLINSLKGKMYAKGTEQSSGIGFNDIDLLKQQLGLSNIKLPSDIEDSLIRGIININGRDKNGELVKGTLPVLHGTSAKNKAVKLGRPLDTALDQIMDKDEANHKTTFRDVLIKDIFNLGKKQGLEPNLDEVRDLVSQSFLNYIKKYSTDLSSALKNIETIRDSGEFDDSPFIKNILDSAHESLQKRIQKMSEKTKSSIENVNEDGSSKQEVSTTVEEVVSHAGQVIRERISQIDKGLESWGDGGNETAIRNGKTVVGKKEGIILQENLAKRKAILDEQGIGRKIYNRKTGEYSFSNLTASEMTDYYDYLKWVEQAIKSNQSKAPVNGKPLDRFTKTMAKSLMGKEYGISTEDFKGEGNFEAFQQKLKLVETYMTAFKQKYDEVKANFKDGIIPDEVFSNIERFAQASLKLEESKMQFGEGDILQEKILAQSQALETLTQSIENHPLNIKVNTQGIDDAINKENEMQQEMDETATKANDSARYYQIPTQSQPTGITTTQYYQNPVQPQTTSPANIPANFTVANLQNIASQFSETTVPINFTPKNLEELINILSQITVPITLTIKNIEGLNPENADATSKFAESITKLRDSLVNIDTSKLSELSTLLGNMTKTTKSGVQLATNVQKIANALTNLKSTIGNMSLSSSTFLGDLKDLVGQGENLKALAKIISSSSQDILKAKKALGTEGKGKSGGKGSTEILQNDRSDVVEKAISSRIADLQKETNDAVITSVKKSFDNVLGGTKQAILNYRYLDKEGRNVSGSEMIMAKKEPVNSKEPNGDKQWVPEVRQLPENTRYEDIERVNGLLKDELSINKDIWSIRSEIAKLDKNSVKDQENRDKLQARLQERIDDRKAKQKEINKESSALVDIAKKDVDYAKKRSDIEKSGKERVEDVISTRRGKEREAQEKEALRQKQKQEQADNKAALRQAQRDAKEFNDREKERERIIEQARKDNEKDFNTQSRDSYNKELKLYERQQKAQTKLDGLMGKDNLSGKEKDNIKSLEAEIDAIQKLIDNERKLREERGLTSSENQKNFDKEIERINENQQIARAAQSGQNVAENARLAAETQSKTTEKIRAGREGEISNYEKQLNVIKELTGVTQEYAEAVEKLNSLGKTDDKGNFALTGEKYKEEKVALDELIDSMNKAIEADHKESFTNITNSFKQLLGFDKMASRTGFSGLTESFSEGLKGSGFDVLEANLSSIGIKLDDYDGDVYRAINANRELQKSFSSLSVKTVDSMVSEVNSQITTLSNKGNKNGLTSDGTAMLNDLNNLRNNLLQIRQEISTNGIVDNTGFENFSKGILEADSSLTQFRTDLQDIDNLVSANAVSLSKFQNKLAKWAQGNSRAMNMREYSEQFKQIEQAANSAGGVTEARLKELVGDFNNLDKEVRSAGVSGLSFFDQWSQRLQSLKSYFMTFFSAFAIINRVREAITTVKELDSAFVEMRKVSNDSLESLEKFANISFNLGDTVGTTGLQMQKSAADFMRIGEDINQATESALNANKLLNVSEFENIDDATESLIAMKAAYNDLTEGEIIDKLNEVGNNYAISTNQLAEGLQKAAATLKTQGNDINEAIALITAGNTTIQDAASVAAGVKVVSLRIAGTKEAEEELKAAGEDVEDYVVMTASKKRQIIKDYTAVASNGGQGVDIYDENGNYKSTYEILKEISEVYKEIQEEDKKFGTNRAAGLIEELAGKNRSNIVAAILNNGEVLNKAYLSSLEEAEGSAQDELDKYLDSIEGKQTQIQNKGQQISSDVFNVETIKTALDLANNFLTVVTQITDLLGSWSILIPVAAFEAFKEYKQPGSSLFTSISNGLAKGNNFLKSSSESDSSTAIYSAINSTAINAETASLEANTAAQVENSVVRAAKTSEMVTEAAVSSGLTASEAAELLTTEGVVTAEGALSVARLEEIAAGKTEQATIAGLIADKATEINTNAALAASENGVAVASQEAAKSTGLIGRAFSGLAKVFAPIINFAKANPFTAILIGVGAAVAGATLLYKHFHNLESEIEKSSKAFSDYESAQSDLDELNSKLQETQDRITELNGMNSLTITEQEELNRLKLENEELERQKAILQEIADAKQTESETSTLAALSALTGNYVNAQWDRDTLSNVTRSAIDEIVRLQKDRAKQLEIYNHSKSDEEKFKADNELKAIDAELESYEKQLDKDIPKLDKLRQQLANAETAEGKAKYKELTDLMDDYINRNKSELQVASENFDKFISSEGKGVEELREKLALGAKEGKSLDEVLRSLGISIWNIPTASLSVMSEYFEKLKSGAAGVVDEIEVLSLNIDELATNEESAISRIEKAFGEDASEKGDTYASMLERIKTAKELVESGDIGTEKFKSIASFFSPTGADDLDDWKENLPKINKYFTEDTDGVYKFLDDLTKTLNDMGYKEAEIKDGFYNLPDYFDAEKVGKKLGIGGEAVVTLMGEAMDKGLSQDFFTDSESGFNTLIGLENELSEAQLELNKLESDKSTSKTRLDAQREKVEDLKIRINQCTDSLDTMFKKFETGDGKKDKGASAAEKKLIGQYAQRYNQLNERKWATESERKQWESQRGQLGQTIIQAAAEKGVKLEYNKRGQLVRNKKKSDEILDKYAEAIRNKDWEYIDSEAKKRGIKGSKKEARKEFKRRYGEENWLTEEQIQQLNQTDTQNNTDAVGENTNSMGENTSAINTLTGAIDGLTEALGYDPKLKEPKSKIDETPEESIDSAINEKIERHRRNTTTTKKETKEKKEKEEKDSKSKGKKKASAFENFFTGNNGSVNAGEVPEEYAESISKVEDALKSEDSAAQKSLATIGKYTEEQLKSADLTGKSSDDMSKDFMDLMDTLDLSYDSADKLIEVLSGMGLLKVEPKVDLSGITSVDQLNDTLSGKLETGQSVTYTADVEGVQTDVKAVEEQEGVIKYTAEDLDGVQKEVEPYTKQDGTISYKFVPDKNSEKDKDGKKNEDGGTITTKFDANTDSFDKHKEQVEKKMQSLSKETAKPDVDLQGASSANTQLRTLENTMNRLDGKKSKVTLTTVKEFITKSSKQENTGRGNQKFNGTFHTSNAYAGGTNVSLPKNETALINELGEEIVVRNGKAMTFNNGYPTFAKLKRGDIIFNHKFKIVVLHRDVHEKIYLIAGKP